MSFAYDPKDASPPLIADGEYDAKIESVEETTSKAGNHMLKLAVRVWANGHESILFDYVVVPSSLWKLKQISTALDKLAKFEAGKLEPQEISGASLRVFVKTRKDETGKYNDQNVITKYLKDSAEPGSDVAKDSDPF